MVFPTDSDLSYVYLQYKSEKVYGLFGLGWKNQEHTAVGIKDSTSTVTSVNVTLHDIFLTNHKYFCVQWRQLALTSYRI